MGIYKTTHSRFFLIFDRNHKVEVSNFKNLGCKKIDDGQFWLCCADNFSGLPVDIGYRHKNGDGVCLRILKGRESIFFESDEMSGIPVFWIKKDEKIIIASDLSLIINIGKKLFLDLKIDLNSASEFLTTGYIFTSQKTLIQDVCLLPPKNRLVLNVLNGNLKIEEYGEEFKYSKNRLDKNDAPVIFRNILEKGFKRHSDKKIALLLSGGGSSRILASCAIAAGLDIDFYTFGQSSVNDSDFSIANKVAYNLGKKTHCFMTSSENFISNWKKTVAYSNWTNDSIWWAARIPDSFFEELGKYDLVIRGDGDGCYGWGGNRVSISDILHLFEITPNAVIPRFNRYFSDPELVFSPAKESRNNLVGKYESMQGHFLEAKNILYREIRECHGAAPGSWYFSRFIPIDTPFLWQECLRVAFSLPKDKLVVRWVIFAALELDKKIKGIPFSGGGSWDNRLEFYYSGVWEELIAYAEKWSPWKLNIKELQKDFLKPPEIPEISSVKNDFLQSIRKSLNNKYIRRFAFKYFPHLAYSSMSERLVIRLALLGNLCEVLMSKQVFPIVSSETYGE